MASAPPPIEAEPGDGRLERFGIIACHALAGGSLVGWLPSSLLDLAMSPGATAITVGAAALAGSLIGAAAGAKAWTPPVGPLRWNGREWSLAGQTGQVEVRIDAGPWMLLRFRSADSGTVWFTLDSRTHADAWHALRIALLHATPGGSAGGDGSDEPGWRTR
jgi:hypothetical protein